MKRQLHIFDDRLVFEIRRCSESGRNESEYLVVDRTALRDDGSPIIRTQVSESEVRASRVVPSVRESKWSPFVALRPALTRSELLSSHPGLLSSWCVPSAYRPSGYSLWTAQGHPVSRADGQNGRPGAERERARRWRSMAYTAFTLSLPAPDLQ